MIALIISILFLIFAIILSSGKGAPLLAGYNTMPDDEKALYDEIALCKFMGKIMYGISFSIVLFALSELLSNLMIFIVGLVLLIGLIVFSMIYTNTKNRFKKKS